MGTPKTGDRVRVTYEGAYAGEAPYGGHVLSFPLPNYPDFRTTIPAGAAFEVLPKPLKVGATIEGCAAFDSLPRGAVVTEQYGSEQHWMIADGKGGLLGTHGGVWPKGKTYGARTLVYLPEQTA